MTCLATTPPECGSDFTDAVYQNATLYVPMRSLERYQNAAVWCNFQHIEGIDTGDDHQVGDVNHDGHVNLKDVSDLINYLLTEDASAICQDCADVDGDTHVSVADVAALIQKLLSDN